MPRRPQHNFVLFIAATSTIKINFQKIKQESPPV